MRRKNIFSIVWVLVLTLGFTSCEKWIDTSINDDPNNPLDVPMEYILSSIQTNMAYDMGGNDAVLVTNVWMQYFDGVDRQPLAYAKYNFHPADCNNLWNNLYGGEMKDAYILNKKASTLNTEGTPESIYTSGVAKVVMADMLGFVTNLWNDVPYTEAFLGDVTGNTQPKVDTQESVYQSIDALLAEAITNLSEASSYKSIKGDMVFSGNKTSWLATAYALRARYAIMLSKRNGDAAYTNALSYAQSALSNGFTGYAFSKFGTGASAQNPIAQFMRDRSGDLAMCSTFINMLMTDSDPRIAQFATKVGGTYVGSDPSSINPNVSLPGTYVAGATASVTHMGLAELYFIMAEANLEKSSPDAAAAFTAFNNGVDASLNQVLGTAAVKPNNLPANAASLTLQDIIKQKYIANFGTVQGFNDWRRTGYPSLPHPVNAIMTNSPRRYPYSEEEVTYNPNNVSNDGISLDSRVWWDVQ